MMDIETAYWNGSADCFLSSDLDPSSELAIYFGDRKSLPESILKLRKILPHAVLLGCSSGGQIYTTDIEEPKLVVSAIKFSSTKLKSAKCLLSSATDSRQSGNRIGKALKADDLAFILVVSDGLKTNGSELAAGISEIVGLEVPVTGGLAGDGADFGKTLVGLDECLIQGQVAAIGLYGNAIQIGHGSAGGWKPFGPKRKVTRSKGNILYEIDGQPALDLYEKYLGEEAENLPSSALLFPLQISDPNIHGQEVVRTILNIGREDKSMTFAGNIPNNFDVQLMRGSVDSLTDGAESAAEQALNKERSGELAILVSCIGRKLMMQQRSEDEIDAVKDVLGSSIPSIGFYSYGEICPKHKGESPVLHNQTMTVTVLTEQG